MEKTNEVEVVNTPEVINSAEADASAQESTASSDIETKVDAENAVAESEDKKSKKKEKPVLSKKEKNRKIANTIVNTVLIVAIVLAAICTYMSFVATSGSGVPSFFGIRLLTVQTDSMMDTLMPGDLIVDTPVKDAKDLRQNDIITYWTIIGGERVLNTHRIVNIYDGGEFCIFETQGDNNTIADPLTVHENEIVGKYLFRIPGVGKVIDYMQSPLGFFLVVVLPVLIFFIYHLIQFFRVLFEYQNVKALIKYEQERGANEDIIEATVKDEQEKEEIKRAAYEAELREKMRAELLAELVKEQSEQGKDGEK